MATFSSPANPRNAPAHIVCFKIGTAMQYSMLRRTVKCVRRDLWDSQKSFACSLSMVFAE
jgi:hypothetical protein